MPYDTFWGPSGPATETFNPRQLLAGNAQVITKPDTLAQAAGACVFGQVLGRITASGLLTKHNPGAADGSQNAVAILAQVGDATAGNLAVQVYVAGEFNMDALTYHANTDTDAEKLAVFGDKSPIIVKKLGDWGQLG